MKEIRFADETKIDIFREQVDLVLYALGFDPEEVFVSDESQMSDFLPDCDLSDTQQRLGLDINEDDFVWEVAARLKKLSE